MVAPDYHEEDGHSTASSTTQLPSQHPLRQRLQGHRDGGTDLSTVPPTPLNHRRHLLSPLRTETPSHGYNLRSTPDREGSQGDGFGLAVASLCEITQRFSSCFTLRQNDFSTHVDKSCNFTHDHGQ
jgi:hypothetical protein